MTAEELLLALKDIHPPEPPAWWQLAPIWWVIVAILLSAVALLVFLKIRRTNQRLAKMAHRELEALISQHRDRTEGRALLLALAGWLKRVALLAYPQARLEGLSGDAWLEFLDRCLGDKSFSRGPGKVFGEAIYQDQLVYDSSEVIQLCRNWMNAVSPVLLSRGKT